MDRNDFQDIKVQNGDVSVTMNLSSWYDRFMSAQEWLSDRIVEDMEPYEPIDTGALRNFLKWQNAPRRQTGETLVYKQPLPSYPRNMYYGYNNRGEKMRFRNPLATERWFTTAKMAHQYEWINGVKERIGIK